jgi:Leucine-rich repeat (LRR) protein
MSTIPVSALAGLDRLNTLALGFGMRTASLGFLKNNTRLSRLRVVFPLSSFDLSDVLGCRGLRSLSLSASPAIAERIHELARLPNLQELSVRGTSLSTLERLSIFQSLRTLTLRSCNVGRIERIQIPRRMRRLVLEDCTVDSAYPTPIPDGSFLPDLEALIWRGGKLLDVHFLAHLPKLQFLEIEDDESIQDLDALRYVPSGCKIVIRGSAPVEDESPITSALARGCEVQYEPSDDLSVWGGQAVS